MSNNRGGAGRDIGSGRMGRTAQRIVYPAYVLAFLVYLYAPLVVTSTLAFNDNDLPSFPWKGLTLDWFYNPDYGKVPGVEATTTGEIGAGSTAARMGVLNDEKMLLAIKNSLLVAAGVTALSLIVGTTTSFFFERHRFRGASVLYFLMMAPLVIPGVILGVSILSFANSVMGPLETLLGRELARGISALFLPSLPMVVLGQFCFIGTLATMVISSRLRRFPTVQEDAAMDLGASRMSAVWSVTIPYLRPALASAGIVAFLTSFENFSTTLFLVGSEPTLPILFYSRLRFTTTPEINAVSVLLMVSTVLLGAIALGLGRLRSSGGA